MQVTTPSPVSILSPRSLTAVVARPQQPAAEPQSSAPGSGREAASPPLRAADPTTKSVVAATRADGPRSSSVAAQLARRAPAAGQDVVVRGLLAAMLRQMGGSGDSARGQIIDTFV